jgi:ribosomal protein S18 acetylase RimI-like enzyme
MIVRPYEARDEALVISLWERCGLTRPWNDPRKDIARKLAVQPELFLVGLRDDAIVASVMAGYDGHRGWINYLAVEPSLQKQGLGRRLMQDAEQRLRARGCPKINLQVRAANDDVIAFYQRLGYLDDAVVSFGKRLELDEPKS